MCSGPRKPSLPPSPQTLTESPSLLLELAAAGDVSALRRSSDQLGVSALWYGPSLGSGVYRLAMEERTPLMIACLYGNVEVVELIVGTVPGEVGRCSASDGATAMHLAACGGAAGSEEVVVVLVSAGADVEAVDSSGRRPGDLIPRNLSQSLDKALRLVLKVEALSPSASPPCTPPKKCLTREDSKKEYPPDLTLPDIKTGIYSTDEFRMYAFKIKPCSRAYSHDWTECPFVHPGENARRRDPRKFFYSCVPCPDFHKGTCRKSDNCEYAHGVFESWLHPAQYRTRLCKDEVGCKRRICFFAHKHDELRSVNPSAVSVGSGSPRAGSMDMATAFLMMQQNGGPGSPLSSSSSPARMKTPLGVREMDLDLEMLSLDPYAQKLFDKMSNGNNNLSSPRSNWGNSPSYESNLSSSPFDTSLLSQLPPDLHPTQLFSNYESNLSSSPLMSQLNGSGMDNSAMAKAVMNARATAFAKRSQSFSDRRPTPAIRPSSLSVMTSAATSAAVTSAAFSDWASPGGKLDWGVQGEELNKLRKSASFGFRNGQQPINPVGPGQETGVNPWTNNNNNNNNGSGIYNTDLFGAWPEQEPMRA